jgi:predicted nucleotidyltransferase component of viral defense system
MKNAMQLKSNIKIFAQKNNISAQSVMQIYMFERLLERISVSEYKEIFILKGGVLISSIVGLHSRTTMDMDTTLKKYPLSKDKIINIFKEICSIKLDELHFSFLNIESIRDEDIYGGFRVSLIAEFQTIKVPLKVDITTGDLITPKEISYEYHTLFDDKTIHILAYNIETVLAEKYETILRRSIFNTRPRDYYDIYILLKTQHQNINKSLLSKAIRSTFLKRQSSDLLDMKINILEKIKEDRTMHKRWEKYSKDNFYAEKIAFDDIIEILNKIKP